MLFTLQEKARAGRLTEGYLTDKLLRDAAVSFIVDREPRQAGRALSA